jgi:hypothetical protein
LKVEKKQDPSIFSPPTQTYCGGLETLFFKIWRIWAIFHMENPLYRSTSYFSGQNLAKLHPKKLASINKYGNILLRNTIFCCFEVILFLKRNLQKIFCFQITLSTFGNISQKRKLLLYNIGMSTGIEEV